MIKSIVRVSLATIWVIFKSQAFACEVCGCGPGASQVGYLPYQQFSLVGFSQIIQRFESNHPGTDVFQEDRFVSTQLMARKSLSRIWNVQGSINYQWNQQGNKKVEGIGDLQVTLQRNLYNNPQSDSTNWQVSSFVRVGLKAPTGKYQSNERSLSPGTGTWDGIIGTTNWLQKGKSGVSLSTVARMNTPQNDGYKFGNSTNSDLRMFHWFKSTNALWVPSVGIHHRYQSKDFFDYNEKLENEYSGGYVLFGQMGVDLYIRNIAFRATYRHLWESDLSGGHTTPRPQFKIDAILFLFKNSESSSAMQFNNR